MVDYFFDCIIFLFGLLIKGNNFCDDKCENVKYKCDDVI